MTCGQLALWGSVWDGTLAMFDMEVVIFQGHLHPCQTIGPGTSQ